MAKQSKMNVQYFNEFGKNITKSVDDGSISFFTERIKASEAARVKRSYMFEVFDEKKLIGFGVAK